MRKSAKFLSLSIISIAFFMICESCKKDVLPENPFENIDLGDTTNNGIAVDSTSFTFVHKTIFEPRCANPGCHDGSFEPDFRNVQSAFATLVYHPIIKNNAAEDFSYRVVPFDTTLSVLHERLTNCCFVNVNDRMPQDNIGIPLSRNDIQLIEDWIMSGAKDMFGQLASLPDNYPNVGYFIAANSDFSFIYSDDRIDSNYQNPFLIPNDSLVNFVVLVSDDITEVCDLTVNQVKMSYDIDFATVISAYNAACFDAGNEEYVWAATFNSSDFNTGITVYMRYYVNDGEHIENTEFPNDNSYDGYKGYWSFKVQP